MERRGFCWVTFMCLFGVPIYACVTSAALGYVPGAQDQTPPDPPRPVRPVAGCGCSCKPQASSDLEALRSENAKLSRKVAKKDEEIRNLHLRLIRIEGVPSISDAEYLRRLQTPAVIEEGDVIIPAGD